MNNSNHTSFFSFKALTSALLDGARQYPIIACLIIASSLLYPIIHFLGPNALNVLFFPYSPAEAWHHKQLWRFITPILLHFSILHLLFNIYAVALLGRHLEAKSKWTFVFLIIWVALISNSAQWLMSGPQFGGLSGIVYGLFGYTATMYLITKQTMYQLQQEVIVMLLISLIIGFTSILGNIANTAHIIGLLSGVVFAVIQASKHLLDIVNKKM